MINLYDRHGNPAALFGGRGATGDTSSFGYKTPGGSRTQLRINPAMTGVASPQFDHAGASAAVGEDLVARSDARQAMGNHNVATVADDTGPDMAPIAPGTHPDDALAGTTYKAGMAGETS